MELDATFKPSGRPHNPNKERQLKERLCFNCNKPGHMARECKQPKKGNNGRKFGRQLNATWQGRGGYNAKGGQLNATFTNKPDWGINGDSTPEEENSSEEEYEPLERELTESQKLRLQEFEEEMRKITFKDNLPEVVDIYRQSML